MESTEIRPFTISVSDQTLAELSTKLELTRLPDELDLPSDQEWDWGIPLAVLKPVVEYWRTKYDWRAVELNINQTLPQFTTHIESLDHGLQEVHFVHKRSNNPAATPLIFIHGWPGNFLEVSKIIDELTNPTDLEHYPFHVVAPSLPGFVFSPGADTPGMDTRATAFVFDKLMKKLGYKHYLAQGGDWGALVCRSFAVHHQDTCLGIHQNLLLASPPSLFRNPLMLIKTVLGFVGLPGGYSEEDIQGLKAAQEYSKTGNGYSAIQGTRPQTLAVALSDSPAGLLAWIGEKLYAWSDKYPWSPEELITWTMLYWINGPASSLRYYKEYKITMSTLSDSGYPPGFKWSPTPFGYSSFSKDIYHLPLEWAGMYHNLVYSKKHNKGGHFASWEVPELLAEDIRKFTQIVASKDPRLSTIP